MKKRTASALALVTLAATLLAATPAPADAPVIPVEVAPAVNLDWTATFGALAHLADTRKLHEIEDAVAALQARLGAFLDSLAPHGSIAGGHSDRWWQGVANCEQGGRNDPWFGYFSWMRGQTVGMDWRQQVDYSNAAIASIGEERMSRRGPWADLCVDRGYEYSPSG